MTVSGQEIELSEYALKQLAAELNIPGPYLIRCPASLQAANIDEGQRLLSNRKRSRVVVGDGKIQALTSPNFIPVKNVKLYDRLVEQGGKSDPTKVIIDHFEHSWVTTRISISHSENHHKVANSYVQNLRGDEKVGDIVRAGVNYMNSLVNEQHTEIEPYAYRLDCLNRMVTPLVGRTDGLSRFRFPRDGSVTSEDWLGAAIDEIGKQFEPLFRSMDAAAQRVITNPRDVLRDQMTNAPGTLRDAVLEAFDEEPTPTVWGIVNAFTRAATHASAIPPRHRLTAERYAGWYATAGDICTTCGKPSGHAH